MDGVGWEEGALLCFEKSDGQRWLNCFSCSFAWQPLKERPTSFWCPIHQAFFQGKVHFKLRKLFPTKMADVFTKIFQYYFRHLLDIWYQPICIHLWCMLAATSMEAQKFSRRKSKAPTSWMSSFTLPTSGFLWHPRPPTFTGNKQDQSSHSASMLISDAWETSILIKRVRILPKSLT